jgi:hypothetical protein
MAAAYAPRSDSWISEAEESAGDTTSLVSIIPSKTGHAVPFFHEIC